LQEDADPHRPFDLGAAPIFDGSNPGTLTVTRSTPAIRRRRRSGARIAALSLADSPVTLTQAEVLERLRLEDDEFAQRIFARSGVERRHLQFDDEFLELSLQGRTERVERELLERSMQAVDALELDPATVGTVISASLYSLGSPSLAHRLIERYAMNPTTDKYHITGVGCASAVPLFKLASQALRDHPDRHSLVVAAESMSGILMRARADDERAKTVGSSLFGDGCAAALLSADAEADGPLILDTQVHQVAGTLDAVELQCGDEDSHLHLARELPTVAGAELGAIAERFLRRNGVRREQIHHWIVHPGGRRIIENVESALALSDEQTALSWRALAEHGNVGTPSILYVLADTIAERDPQPGERGLAVTIGPGVTVGLMLLGW
jgi:alkylresorcinol/alkylpyrone synthase